VRFTLVLCYHNISYWNILSRFRPFSFGGEGGGGKRGQLSAYVGKHIFYVQYDAAATSPRLRQEPLCASLPTEPCSIPTLLFLISRNTVHLNAIMQLALLASLIASASAFAPASTGGMLLEFSLGSREALSIHAWIRVQLRL